MLATARDQLISNDFLLPEKRETVSESERQLLGQLFRRGPSTQADLTKLLPISQQSISRMGASLEDRRMIRRGDRQLSGQRGQPSVTLELNPSFAATIGISLMADGIAVTLTDFAGGKLGEMTPPVKSLGRSDVIGSALGAAEKLIQLSKTERERVFGIGVATTGFRVGDGATFNTPPSLESFALMDLEELFADAFVLPAWADNDGNTATVAENMKGVGRRIDNFAYYYIATGVGGGIIMNGSVVTGTRGNAGEFVGVLPPDEYVFPNLELLRQALEKSGTRIESVNELVRHYDDSWPEIDAWIDQVAPSLSLMASATSAILDTEAIVLGGLLPRRLSERLIPAIDFYDIKRRGTAREHAVVIPAECEGDATAIGASLLPLSDKYFRF